MPSFKQIWFQLHWFVGITAGTVLIVIGLSGAVFSFHEEILGWLNPGTASVPVREGAPLSPAQIAQALQAGGEQRVIQRITVLAEPGRSVQVGFKPAQGQRRGQTILVDPYTGAQLPEQHGAEFFEWSERLHRWLLLPRDDGKPITGTLAICLLMLSLSGLYLRWPRRPLSWRAWLSFDTALKGRSFLWGLHSVVGTWALITYVVFTLTGMYWAFGVVRSTVDGWAGVPARVAAPAAPAAPAAAARADGATRARPEAAPAQRIDISAAWAAFERTAPGWQLAQLRLPERPGQALQISWLDAHASHERARNQLALLPDGTTQRDERYADLPAGRRAVGAIYPLHMGTYFGMPGRIVMTLGSLALPLFAITGWMLYLDRRRKARAVARERQALMQDRPGALPAGQDPVLVAYASQAGHAERLALATASALRGAGLAATPVSVAGLDAEQLRHHRRVLFVASSFGEGDPPDAARRFARLLGSAAGSALPNLQYGLLALGDRHYAAFCGFGHALDHQLRRLGAQPIFPLIEMDGEDGVAWNAWQQALAGHFGAIERVSTQAGSDATAFADWRLQARSLCNAGSQGAGLYALELAAPEGLAPLWRAGALVEILPRHGADTVDAWLRMQGCDGQASVQWQGRSLALYQALQASALPAPAQLPAGTAPQAVADALRPLSPRSYSVASLPQDGHVQLLVRQARHDAGLGVASGWLTAQAPLGSSVALRLVENRAFEPRDGAGGEGEAPAIFIGNGSGYAGLRGHLLARMRAGHHRNWLLFGERQRAHDGFCEAEASGWLAAGQLARADFVYSRDQAGRRYVQDALREAAEPLRRWLAEGAVLYVCGSADGMAAGVDAALAEVLGATAVEDLIVEGRYRRDVY